MLLLQLSQFLHRVLSKSYFQIYSILLLTILYSQSRYFSDILYETSDGAKYDIMQKR